VPLGSYYNIVTYTGNSHLAFRGSSRVLTAILFYSILGNLPSLSSRRDRRRFRLARFRYALRAFTSPNSSISDLHVYVVLIDACHERGVTTWDTFWS